MNQGWIHASLAQTNHRPWPLPAGRWRWRQTWSNVAFLHYRVKPDALRPFLPAGLTLQMFDGSAWLGVVPFFMRDVMRGSLPSFPPLRAFGELNIRTYVEQSGRPGVWFFSLDADCWPIVAGGRAFYGLPYFKARIEQRLVDGRMCVQSTRTRGGQAFTAEIELKGEEFNATPGSFEHWATERYCLYAVRRGTLVRVDVHHRPWPLRRADADVQELGVVASLGLRPELAGPVCHFSPGVEVISYSPARLNE